MGRIRIGISGWQYDNWEGAFYPHDIPKKQHLEYLASVFPTVEINGTFYSLKQPKHFSSWYARTPRDFVLSVKGGRFITHMKRLADVRVALANHFASGVLELGDKLGPHLWQLPANFRFDAERLESFLELLPRNVGEAQALAREHDDRVAEPCVKSPSAPQRRLRHALEVRHESFRCAQFISMLRRYGIALVASHSDRWPYFEDVTAGFVYVRLHGPAELYASPYDDRALKYWSDRVRLWRQGRQPADAVTTTDYEPPARKQRDVYVYFDNTDKVHAPANARRMMAELGLER